MSAPVTAARATRRLRIDLGPVGLRVAPRAVVVCAILTLLALATATWALTLGEVRIPAADALRGVLGTADPGIVRVVREWRLPRALAGLVFGAALALSGGIFQGLTRNPLASPDIIGFSSGSYTGALVVMLVVSGSTLQVALGAVLGGLATAVLVLALSYRGGIQGFRLIIIGIGVSAMLGSLNAYLMLVARLQRALQAATWGAGSLADASGASVAISGVLVIACTGVLIAIAPSLSELDLGDEVAASHGVRIRAIWCIAVMIGVVLTAVVTAASGPIAFVALAAPQIARRLVRASSIPLATSACLGAFLLGAADLVAQHALRQPVPVGLVTIVLGGAYLVHLVLREGRRARP